MRRADAAAEVDPAAVGQPHIEHHDVGQGGGDPAQRLLRGRGLAHHLEIALGIDQVGDAPADDLVIVDQEYACHARLLLGGGQDAVQLRRVPAGFAADQRQVAARAARHALGDWRCRSSGATRGRARCRRRRW